MAMVTSTLFALSSSGRYQPFQAESTQIVFRL